MTHVIVVIGGGTLAAEAVATAPPGATVIAADSGLDHAIAARLRPDALVGDLDSISASGRMWAYAHELIIDVQPTDKDVTDTELALAAAAAVPGATHLLLLGGAGDRLDHVLGTLLALGHPALAVFETVRAWIGTTEFAVVHGGRRVELDVEPGRTFSVLALHGPAAGVTVKGARWELTDAELNAAEARGVSNEAEEQPVVKCTSGVVTVVVP
jgi:thiamine pyrophosphokinase